MECQLFPGYLVTGAAKADWPKVLRTPGVLTVVREGGKPAPLADNLVTSVRDAIGLRAVDATTSQSLVSCQFCVGILKLAGALSSLVAGRVSSGDALWTSTGSVAELV